MRFILTFVFAVAFLAASVAGEQHQHGDHEAVKIDPPKVFLDKSPRVVAYQLQRLDNQRLLLVDRNSNSAKFIPVYEAILARPGMSPQHQQESVDALVKLQSSNPVTVLLAAIDRINADDPAARRAAAGLAELLLSQPAELLRGQSDELSKATTGKSKMRRTVGFAGLIAGGQSRRAWNQAQTSDAATTDYLAAVPLLPAPSMRAERREEIVGLLESRDKSIVAAAISALAFVPTDQQATFDLVAELVADEDLRAAAVQTLLALPKQSRNPLTSQRIVESLVRHAEQIAAKDRTTDDFVDAMQLVDQLLSSIPAQRAAALRQRLRAVTVRIVKIETVEEEMRYNLPYFAVQAGSDVQVVLQNHDLMPHNLVITMPGKLKQVANEGLGIGQSGGRDGLPYVPDTDDVLFATPMLQSDQTFRLTFTAPVETGEYPYVCTYPQHWYRMYGVMVVVEDLDQWNRNPVEPANPIGSNRSFVQAWTVADLQDLLEAGLQGRTPSIGEKIFAEASCLGCHKIRGQGGAIGPDLSDLFVRWKGDRVGVLQEILDPSHKVDAKYQMQLILTADGRTVSGIVVQADDDRVTILENPEAKAPTVIDQDNIEEIIPAQTSMMPKALMDNYTRDEIFEMLAYLEHVSSQ